jgi:hypothetical protein
MQPCIVQRREDWRELSPALRPLLCSQLYLVAVAGRERASIPCIVRAPSTLMSWAMAMGTGCRLPCRCPGIRDENGTEIFRIDRFSFLYYKSFFNMKNCQFQSISQQFSTIFLYSLIVKCRNIPNRPFSFFYIVSPFSTVLILTRDTYARHAAAPRHAHTRQLASASPRLACVCMRSDQPRVILPPV